MTTPLTDPHTHSYTVRVASRRVPEPIRRFVFERDKVCRCCGTSDRLVIDHIKPWADGGTHDPSNLQVLCRPCNARKRRRDHVYAPIDGEPTGNDPAMGLVALRVEPELIAAVDRLADEGRRTRSEMIRMMLAYGMAEMPKGWKP